jgi:hypothetical protein
MLNLLDKFKKRNTILEETINTHEAQRFLELRKKYNIQQKPITDAEKDYNIEENKKVSERQQRFFERIKNEKD